MNYLLLFINLFFANNDKPTLIYVGDPMCSWCYGISEELEKTKQHYTNQLNFELVLGGLRPYNQQTMLELKDFLTEHWQHVNQASNLPFNYQILNSENITYDTEPPCRATVIARDLKPQQAFAFFKMVQKAFYFENKNLHNAESYKPILKELEIDFDEFEKNFNSENYKTKVRKDFERAGELKVRSFPTILLLKDGKYKKIASGFATFDEMKSKIDAALN